MSSIEDAIYSRISVDAGVIALVGNRIYPIRVAQDSALPSVSYNRVDTVPVNALRMSSSLASSRFQFDCWSKSTSEAGNIASKIKSSLDGFFGSILGVRIDGIMMLDQISDYEPDAEIFREIIDFDVWHTI